MPVTARLVSATCLLAAGACAWCGEAAGTPPLTTPPQDQGLPYTRSAHAAALARIKDHIAVFAGSRYAYVHGFKVRLDDAHPLNGDAVLADGRMLVPAVFAGVLDLKNVQLPPAPLGLADRWVHELPLPPVSGPPIDLIATARAKGLVASLHPRGLLLIGTTAVDFSTISAAHLDSIITLFDTPEKFADPAIATRSIPTLKRWGTWTDHVKATPEQIAIINGPETTWPTAPTDAYRLDGIDLTLLGSRPPAPGIYPRLLFSPEDVPTVAARVTGTRAGQMALIEMEHLFRKSWWDPATSDGQVFRKLATGDLTGLEWDIAPGSVPAHCPHVFKGQKPGITNSHVAYVPECLCTMALWCLLTGDQERGRQVAAAIANYYKLREALIDEWMTPSDSELGASWTRADGTVVKLEGAAATTHWRTMHGPVAHMNLGLALDFAGRWMDAGQKDVMRRVIAKSTYGRRAYGQDGPVRFRDVNWVTWDLPQFLALAAIEGLEGFDREAYAANARTVRAFCDWGMDPDGVVYESNGKTPGGFQFQLLSMVVLARRGENCFAHPHWRKLLAAQVQMTSPTGKVVVNSGTQYAPFSNQPLSYQFTEELAAFYPNERCADHLLGLTRVRGDAEQVRTWTCEGFDAAAYREAVAKVPRLRLPSPTYPGFVRSVLYARDHRPTTRAELGLPLDFHAPVHGVFSAFSDATPQALWINLMARPDHYLGAGHHHADAGMFHVSALGVDWFTESPFSQVYDGKYHNQVLVDGRSQADNMPGIANGYQAAATWLGATVTPGGSCASTDLTNSYSWRWLTQPPQVWTAAMDAMGWELDPSPANLRTFAGTGRYKMRPWWSNSNFVGYMPTARAPFNPMERVFRSIALVRGAHPWALVVDDLKKDGAEHLFQWTAMLNGGVWQAAVPGLARNQTALAARPWDPKATAKAPIQPQAGEPLLLVCALGMDAAPAVTTEVGVEDRKGVKQNYDRIAIDHRGIMAAYRVLLLPVRMGEALPAVAYDAAAGAATVSWPGQEDRIAFSVGADGRTRFNVRRNGQVVTATP